ncbi:hypothetical protein FRB96_006987 [Tulasnella sp. 330]|nr:hypothetical protein FRB96_006987 [Tulasnella sp. 330]
MLVPSKVSKTETSRSESDILLSDYDTAESGPLVQNTHSYDHVHSNTSRTPNIASPARDDVITAPRVNHIYIKEQNGYHNAKVGWTIDPTIRVPPSLLASLEEGEARANLRLHTQVGSVTAKVRLISDQPTKSFLYASSEHGSVTVKINQHFKLKMDSQNGTITAQIPSDFEGPVTFEMTNGSLKFSELVQRRVAHYSFSEKTGKAFIGDWTTSGYADLGDDVEAWGGDELILSLENGNIRIEYAQESPEMAPGEGALTYFWRRLMEGLAPPPALTGPALTTSLTSRTSTNFAPGKKDVSLLHKFKGIVSTPSDVDTYENKRWAANVMKTAAYIVYPTDVADISVAILFAREEKLPIAISGAGHNVGGASSTEGGVVIDMRKMNAVRVDKENKIGYIQGGTTLAQAAKELFKHGMTTTLGHAGSVSVAGLVTGGGLSFKVGEYGLACDNIVSATMVLANGEIVTVDDEHHPDLLWGIKGGGSNFGVVAELGMKLHEARPDVCIIQHSYLPEQLPAIVEELTAWFEVQTPQETLILSFCMSDGKPHIGIDGTADLSAEDAERAWGRFRKLNPVKSKVTQMPYDIYYSPYDDFSAMTGNKVQSPAHVSKFDYDSAKKAYDEWLAVAVKIPASCVFYEFYPFDLMAKVPVEATAFAHRTTDKLALIGVYGYDDGWTAEAKQAVAAIQACVTSSSSEEAKNSIGYLNHSGLAVSSEGDDMDGIAKRAFGPNYPRLRQLKRKYDPDMVFNKWFCIRPADE